MKRLLKGQLDPPPRPLVAHPALMCPFWHDAESLLPKEVELQRAEDMAQQRAVEMPGTAENRTPFALESKGTT